MSSQAGWAGLFWNAFKRSRNAMALLDDERRAVEANPAFLRLVGHRRATVIGRPFYEFVADGPIASPGEWRAAMAQDEFTGVADMIHKDGTLVTVQWAGHPETATGRRLALVVAMHSVRSGRRLPTEDPTGDPLSDREREVVRLIGHGNSGPEIAEELRISHNTVRTHAHNAMTKLGARSRAHLVAKALGEGHLAA
jgi:PAS domain S-box-containing protein